MKEYFCFEEYEFLKPNFDKINFLINCAYDDCDDTYFHYFVY